MISFAVVDPIKGWRLGILPQFFDEADPRPAREQINENYAHGGGWHPFEGFELGQDKKGYYLDYPEDPPMREIARAKLRDETIVLFQYDWVAIIQKDGTFEIASVD